MENTLRPTQSFWGASPETDPGSLAFAYLVCIRSSIGLGCETRHPFSPRLFPSNNVPFLVFSYLLLGIPSLQSPSFPNFSSILSIIEGALELGLPNSTRAKLSPLLPPPDGQSSLCCSYRISHHFQPTFTRARKGVRFDYHTPTTNSLVLPFNRTIRNSPALFSGRRGY